MSSTGFTTFSALLLFFSLSITLCVFLYIFYAISSNIDEARSVRPSANVFVFGDFNVHHRDWLNSFDRTVKLCYNFLNISNVIITQMTLFRRLTFLLCSLTVTLTILLYWMYLFLLTRVFVLVFFFPLLENCDHVTVSVSINFASNSKRDVPYHCVAYDCSCIDWDGLCDH